MHDTGKYTSPYIITDKVCCLVEKKGGIYFHSQVINLLKPLFFIVEPPFHYNTICRTHLEITQMKPMQSFEGDKEEKYQRL
jgi:hypothetical protein